MGRGALRFGGMGITDLFWNLSQDDALRRIEESMEDTRRSEAKTLRHLQEENRELQIRVGVLIRLLIERGVFDAQDYTALLNEAQANLAGPRRSPVVAIKQKPGRQ